MPTSAQSQWSGTGRVDPLFSTDDAPVMLVTLAASKTYPAGQVLAEKLGNNEVQAVAVDATAGTFTITFGGQTTTALAYNASPATVQAALELLSSIGAGNVLVGGSAGAYTLTFRNALGYQNVAQVTCDSTSLTGNTHTATPSTTTGGSAGTKGTYDKYNSAASDGTQIAKGILQYGVTTDSSSVITLPGEWGETAKAAPMYIGGGAHFKTSELTGLTDGAVEDLSAQLVRGTVADGILRF